MKKTIITILLVIASVMFISPISVFAKEVNTINIVENYNSNILNDTVFIGDGEPILGDPKDEDSVAWLVQLALNIVKIVGPILVVILSSIDYIMVIVKSDNDAFGKAQKKLITRLILAILLFLIPTIVEILLGIFGITGSVTGGIH